MKQTIKLNNNMDDIKLFGLIMECPLHKRYANCCFDETENLTLEKKYVWLQNMDSDKISRVISHHQQCIHERFKKNF
jgi:hypothetical protein